MGDEQNNTIEVTRYDDGRALWVVRMDGKIQTSGIEVNDPEGTRARAAASAWTEKVRGVHFDERLWRSIGTRPADEDPTDEEHHSGRDDIANFRIMLDQLRHGAVVEVDSLSGVYETDMASGKDKPITSLFSAYLREYPRPPGTMDPPAILGATLNAQLARALVEAGARWFGDASRDPRTTEEASIEAMLSELAAGGTVQLREVHGPRVGENAEDVFKLYRSAYRFSSKRNPPGGNPPPMYARVTIEQAKRLLDAGAEWAGSPSSDPRVVSA
jgi:hypothetical protein